MSGGPHSLLAQSLPTFYYGASGVVRSETFINSESPQCVSQVWEINEADIQLTDSSYPVA